jgi:HEAT repeat protein
VTLSERERNETWGHLAESRLPYGITTDGNPMTKKSVIKFEPKERILEKAKKYVESPELLFEGKGQAVPLLLRAVKLADRELKREIMFLLGTFAKEEFVWPLYDMMTNPLEDEEVRHDAAIQLSVIGPLLHDPQRLADRLLQEIASPDAERRFHATFALGWRGHSQAAIPLIERLYDSDPRVRETAVNALCNLRDDRILDLLLDRLNQGPIEQKKSILFNLWRFDSKAEKVRNVYLQHLEHEDPELRFDALVCIGPITQPRDYLDVYGKCLKDNDSRIRELALKRLAEEAGESALESLRAEIERLLNDPNMDVKKAALAILRKNS